jgi:hypothetical protein
MVLAVVRREALMACASTKIPSRCNREGHFLCGGKMVAVPSPRFREEVGALLMQSY